MRTGRRNRRRDGGQQVARTRGNRSIGALALLFIGILSSCGADRLQPTAPDPPAPPMPPPVPRPSPSGVAFIHAQVIPMDQERVLAGHTVLVLGDSIAAMGPDGTVAIPADALVIDAAGGYLLPGLIDMHVHVGLGTFADLTLYPAYGVTSVRSMWGNTTELQMRAAIASGEVLGPNLYVSSPAMDGAGGRSSQPIHSADEGHQRVEAAIAAGYDFIKVYSWLPLEIYARILATAHARGVRTGGHVPYAARQGQAIALAQGTSEHLLGIEMDAVGGDFWRRPVDTAAVRSLARVQAASGLAEVPTHVVHNRSEGQSAAYAADPAARYLSPELLARFAAQGGWPTSVSIEAALPRRKAVVRILHEEGVTLLAGTDAGFRWVFPGSALHEELEHLVASGLSPYQAIRAATAAAAPFLWNGDEVGMIEVGRRADLLLVSANPLVDVRALQTRVGVLLRGTWHSAEAIAERLELMARNMGR